MVHRVTAVLVDDLDGRSPADETVYFALDGVNYEIDLSTANATKLRECLRPWQECARVVSRARKHQLRRTTNGVPEKSTSRSMTRMDRAQSRAIRTWALANGLRISARGKIPDAVHRAFDEANEARV